MPEIEMLCIANSWKHGGRCVAGVRIDDTSLIRPVSDTELGSLNESVCQLDNGHPVQQLDVVRVDLSGHDPRPHQPENWIVADRPWQLVRRLQSQEVEKVLEPLVVEGPDLFGTSTDRVTWDEVQESDLQASLAIVKAVTPTFCWNRWDPTQRRAEFDLAGVLYNLPITFEFPYPAEGEPIHRSQASWYFTISLGEPLPEKDNDCFKLIAGAIEIPAGS